VHQHLWPEPLVRALSSRRSPPRLRGGRLELVEEGAFEVDLRVHSLEACLARLDRDGVDVAVISCPPTLGLPVDLLAAYHEGILELVAESQGRLLALATDAVLDGFAGTCVAAGTLLDLDLLAPVADDLAARGGVLFVHPGPSRAPAGAPAWWSGVVGYTAQMQAAYAAWLAGGADRWPGLPVVFAILAGGGPFQLERMSSRGADPRLTSRPGVYLDTASYGRRALELCLAASGVDLLVYGSDIPVIDSGPTLEAVRSLGSDVEQALCGRNPARLLA
jgi:Amidohydrolase